MVCITLYVPAFALFQVENYWLYIVAAIIGFACTYAFICSRSALNKVPYNFIIILLFSIAISYTVSFTCAAVSYNWDCNPEYVEEKSDCVLKSNGEKVFIAACITAAMTVGLSIYAFVTKKDITYYGGLLSCGLFILIIATFLLIFFDNEILTIVICAFGVLLFSVYIIYDT